MELLTASDKFREFREFRELGDAHGFLGGMLPRLPAYRPKSPFTSRSSEEAKESWGARGFSPQPSDCPPNRNPAHEHSCGTQLH